MTYKEWTEQVENIRKQYLEGAITEKEYFNAVLGRAYKVQVEAEESEGEK